MLNFDDLVYKTEGIIIRPLLEEDYEEFVKGFVDSLPSQNRFDDGKFDTKFMTTKWYSKLLQRRKHEAESDFSYVFNIFNEEGKSIGYCDITPHRREDFQYARIGYTILNNYWGMGYGTKCVKGLISLGFDSLNLHRLEAHVNLDNPASKRVLIKAGMNFECIRKAFILEDGIWTDNEIYYINNENWKEQE